MGVVDVLPAPLEEVPFVEESFVLFLATVDQPSSADKSRRTVPESALVEVASVGLGVLLAAGVAAGATVAFSVPL